MTDDRKPEPGSAEVAKRMAVLRRHLHDAVPLGVAATDAGISLRTARRWLTRYRADGPAGLARPTRPEAGKRTFPKELVELVEGMALLKSPPSIVTIHRRLAASRVDISFDDPLTSISKTDSLGRGSVGGVGNQMFSIMMTLSNVEWYPATDKGSRRRS